MTCLEEQLFLHHFSTAGALDSSHNSLRGIIYPSIHSPNILLRNMCQPIPMAWPTNGQIKLLISRSVYDMINDGINEDIGHCSTLRSCILFGSQRGRGLPAHSRPQSTLKGRSWWQAPQQGRPNISDRGDHIHGDDTHRKYLTCYSGSTMMLGFPFSGVECSSTSGCHTDPPDKKVTKLLIKMVGHLSNIIQPFKAFVSAL